MSELSWLPALPPMLEHSHYQVSPPFRWEVVQALILVNSKIKFNNVLW